MRKLLICVVVCSVLVMACASSSAPPTTPAGTAIPKAPTEDISKLAPDAQLRAIVRAIVPDATTTTRTPSSNFVNPRKLDDGSWHVEISIRGATGLSDRATRMLTEDTMRKAYQALYTCPQNVSSASIGVYFETTDGDTMKFYQTTLKGPEARRVNWANQTYETMRSVWKTDYLHPQLKKAP